MPPPSPAPASDPASPSLASAAVTLEPRTLVRPAGGPEHSHAFARTEVPDNTTTLVKGPAGSPALSPSSHPPEVDLAPAPLHEQTFEERYRDRALIGEGGMGEVRLCKDHRVGREVAMKVIRPGQGSRSDARARFEREARVQGQLEHPSVVPVYDLGIRPDGSAFFTMKRVRGETLEQVLGRLAAGDPEAAATHTRRRLLGAFSSLCLAVAFAHSRRVLHRDLKPGNIMLGSYGELYILDWGLAKLLGADDPASSAAPASHEDEAIEAPLSQRHRTVAGSMMGTPGYMSPEQIRGEIDALDERTDVFSLGAILFEILALEPLFGRPGDPVQAFLAATLKGADARPSVRAPERAIPPELDAICVRATSPDAAARFADARDVHEAVERFLDGDRDLEQRRAMAERHAARAEELCAAADGGGEGAAEAREEALRETGAALALLPSHPRAVALMMRLLVDAPAELPAEARAEFEQQNHRVDGVQRRSLIGAFSTFLLFTAAMLVLGVKSYPLFFVSLGLAAASPLVAWWCSRPGNTPAAHRWVFAVSTLFMTSVGSFMGPLILVPSLIATNTIAFVAFSDRHNRARMVAVAIAALIVPILLQETGWTPSSYLFSSSGMLVIPQVAELPRVPTLLVLVAANVMVVVTPSLLIARVRDTLARKEERLFAQAWKLRQLVPTEARGAALPAAPAEPDLCASGLHGALHERLQERLALRRSAG
jgi:serine/threonine-protein kinase